MSEKPSRRAISVIAIRASLLIAGLVALYNFFVRIAYEPLGYQGGYVLYCILYAAATFVAAFLLWLFVTGIVLSLWRWIFG